MSADRLTGAEEIEAWKEAWTPIWNSRDGVEAKDEEVVVEETSSEESSEQPRPGESYVGNYNADKTNPDP